MTGRLTLTKSEINTAIRQYLERIGLTFSADSLPLFTVTRNRVGSLQEEISVDHDNDMTCFVDVASVKRD